MKKFLLSLMLLLICGSAEAATCTWSGGTGAWDSSNTASWSCGHVPTTSDAVVFDGTSGGGTVTVNSPNGAGVVTVQSITMGAFTGTLDFSANNNNVTLTAAIGMSTSGTGTRTLNMGDGTWTLSGNGGSVWDGGTVTNFTMNANSSTILFNGTTQTFNFGTKATNIVTIGARSGPGSASDNSGAHTIATFNIIAPNTFFADQNTTTTITNAMNFVGTSTQPIMIKVSSDPTLQATWSSAATSTCTWCAIRGIVFSGGGTFTANNSFNLQNNSGVTFNGPSAFGAGGGCIIGGWLLWRDFDTNQLNDNSPAWLEKAA